MEQIQNILLDCQRSDPQAQRALYDLYKVELLQLCRRYAQDEATAKDIFQEGFVRIFKDLHQYDPNKGQFKHWIKKVMVNSALQHIRAHKKWKGYLELNGIPKDDLTYMDRDMEQMDLGNIYDLITKMPEGYRIVFNMYIIEGYSHKEIASFMGSSEGTSKSQLHKAKQWLRSKLVEMDPMYGKQYGRQVLQG